MALDRTRLRLLLRNLVDNARRHTPAGSQAPQVSVLPSDIDGRPAVCLTVRDFGPGVDEAALPHLG